MVGHEGTTTSRFRFGRASQHPEQWPAWPAGTKGFNTNRQQKEKPMRLFLFILYASVLIGCGHTLFSVSATDKSGIPFLSMESVDSTTLIYEQPWFEITLTADQVPPGTKPDDFAKAKFTVAHTYFHMDPMKVAGAFQALNGVDKPQAAYDAVDKYLQQNGFTATQPSELRWTDKKWANEVHLAGISHTRTQLVSSTTLYINGHTPFGGSASGTVQLSPNGTLAQAQAQAENKLPNDTITAIGGIATAGVTGFATVAAAKAAAKAHPFSHEPEQPSGPQYIAARITATPIKRVYKIVLERASGLQDKECSLDLSIRLSAEAPMSVNDHTCRGGFSVDLVRAGEGGSEKNDANTIQVKGSVVLPSSPGGK